MQKYRVIVHGKNLWSNVDGVKQRFGFYTNVFVEAFTPVDAESRAIELIRGDVCLMEMRANAEDDPLSLSADEIREVQSFDGAQLPRTGLSLYPEKSEGT